MACLSSERRAMLMRQLTRIQTQLELLYDTYESSIKTDVRSYRFDSAEAEQQVNRRSLKELSDEIERLEASELRIMNKLRGAGIVNMSLRRRDYIDYRSYSRGRR